MVERRVAWMWASARPVSIGVYTTTGTSEVSQKCLF
jgi:hypothetical protein